MPKVFSFEREIHETLELMPMAVRRWLDLARLKLSLAAWQALNGEVRRELADAEGVEAFSAALRRAGAPVEALGPTPGPHPWQIATVPAPVRARLEGAARAPRRRRLGEPRRPRALRAPQAGRVEARGGPPRDGARRARSRVASRSWVICSASCSAPAARRSAKGSRASLSESSSESSCEAASAGSTSSDRPERASRRRRPKGPDQVSEDDLRDIPPR